MAETFKNAIIADVSGDSASPDTLYTAPGSTTSIILGVAIANKTSNSRNCTLTFTDTSASSTTEMLGDVGIPGNTTLEVLAGQKYILETGDILKAYSDADSSIDITAGILELS